MRSRVTPRITNKLLLKGLANFVCLVGTVYFVIVEFAIDESEEFGNSKSKGMSVTVAHENT